MVAPLVAAGLGVMAGGAAAGLLGGKKRKTTDITQQLNRIQDTYAQNQLQNEALATNLKPLTSTYQADLAKAFGGAREDFAGNKAELLQRTDQNTKEAQDALRANLYSDTFSAVPGSLQAIREASAAGGGLNTGSYQKAVGEFGGELASKLATGERDIQLQGVQNRQGAQEQAFNAFNQLSSKLTDDQLNGLTKVLDTGREDLIRQYTTSMGLSQDETQAIVDLLNFQQSGQMASDNAAEANRMALITSIIGGGGKLAGSGGGK